MKVGDILNQYNRIINEFPQKGFASEKQVKRDTLEKEFLERLEKLESDFEPKGTDDSFLTQEEKLTLHLLFGAGKPEEFSFYGRTPNLDQIIKGNLLDVKG